MDTLRKQLNAAHHYVMSDETMDEFLSLMTEVRLKNKEAFIPLGAIDNNVYIVKEGITRLAYLDDSKDKTFGFATPGTVTICNSFYDNTPSIFQFEACCDSVVMKITKSQFEDLLRKSDDFKTWMLILSMNQVWNLGNKAILTSGGAKEKFQSSIIVRPELLQKVSSKIIASYIGIHPDSLSRLKRELMPKAKKQ